MEEWSKKLESSILLKVERLIVSAYLHTKTFWKLFISDRGQYKRKKVTFRSQL